MAELIIITGGTCSGKTSVVTELARRGLRTLPEAAMEVITELTAQHGLAAQGDWRRANPQEFQRRITLRQHARETEARQAPAGRIFCDRGALDGRAYCWLAGVDWPDDLRELVAPVRYDHVFVCATLTTFDPRPHSGRLDSREDSLLVGQYLQEIYAPRAQRLTLIPEAPVAARADAILAALNQPPR
ncbi:MAG: AAA family ATPase [Phycisphaerales bacterium JB039]